LAVHTIRCTNHKSLYGKELLSLITAVLPQPVGSGRCGDKKKSKYFIYNILDATRSLGLQLD
jgi:hypothetical protein